ncbi:MAG: flagellar basal body-associated FliL family protein [Deltaproteobacteria bacterium]|nr:flagellar basal body-associated FliL family protein [Deltaproteobacteria bacterium]
MANEDAGEVQQAKSKKGLIIIVVVVLNVLLIGGVAFFLMSRSASGDDAKDPGTSRQTRSTRAVAIDGPIIELDGFVVNLQNARDKKYLKTKMSIQLYSVEDQPEFEKSMSIVRNEILLQLSAIEMEKVQTIEGKRDLEKMLVQKVNGRLDMDRVANIFLTEFVTQ